MDFLISFITIGIVVGVFELKQVNCERERIHLLFHKHSATPYPLTPSFLRTAARAGHPNEAGVRCGADDSCNVLTVSNYVTFEPNFVYAFKEEAIYIYDDLRQDHSRAVSGQVSVGSYFEFKVRPVGEKKFMINLFNKESHDEILRITEEDGQTGLNNLLDGENGTPEFTTTHIFTQEKFYVIRCTIDSDNIQVDVDGSSYHTFPHRLSYSLITQAKFKAWDNKSELEMIKIYLPQP